MRRRSKRIARCNMRRPDRRSGLFHCEPFDRRPRRNRGAPPRDSRRHEHDRPYDCRGRAARDAWFVDAGPAAAQLHLHDPSAGHLGRVREQGRKSRLSRSADRISVQLRPEAGRNGHRLHQPEWLGASRCALAAAMKAAGERVLPTMRSRAGRSRRSETANRTGRIVDPAPAHSAPSGVGANPSRRIIVPIIRLMNYCSPNVSSAVLSVPVKRASLAELLEDYLDFHRS